MNKFEISPEFGFLEGLLTQAPGFVMIFIGPEHRFAFINKEVDVLLGGRNVIGLPIKDVKEPLEEHLSTRLEEVWQSGKPIMAREIPLRVFSSKNRESKTRYADFLHHPIRNKRGDIIGIYVQGNDVTERKHFHEHLAILRQQSVDIVRDIIKMIDRSVNQALRNKPDVKEATKILNKRFALLATIQNYFIDMKVAKNLDEIIKTALLLMLPNLDEVTLEGEALAVNGLYHAPLILLLQSLAYTAIENNVELKNISIQWQLDKDKLDIIWREKKCSWLTKPVQVEEQLLDRFTAIHKNNAISVSQTDKLRNYKISLMLDC